MSKKSEKIKELKSQLKDQQRTNHIQHQCLRYHRYPDLVIEELIVSNYNLQQQVKKLKKKQKSYESYLDNVVYPCLNDLSAHKHSHAVMENDE